MKEFIWNLKIKLQMNDSLEVTRKLELLAIRLLDFLFFFFFLQPAEFFFYWNTIDLQCYVSFKHTAN